LDGMPLEYPVKKSMKCVICGKKTKGNPTCGSPSCAGKLAAAKRKFSIIKNRYQSLGKLDDITNILILIAKYFPENPNILEFYGGGIFREKAHKTLKAEIVSIDNDPIIEIIMKEQQFPWGWGSLYDLADQHFAEEVFDTIYLDYCGNWTESAFNDLEKLFKTQPFVEDKETLFFITINRSRENFKGESKTFVKTFDDSFTNQIKKLLPHSSFDPPIYKNEYLSGSNRMVTFGFNRGYNPKPRDTSLASEIAKSMEITILNYQYAKMRGEK